MRHLLAILAMLVLAQCASKEDDRFRVGESPRAYVIIGVAESASNTVEAYRMLWRQVGADGRFIPNYNRRTSFEPLTNSRSSIRIRGIPGEFEMYEVDPGTYGLDSVFATLSERNVVYFANGVIQGPERPTFNVGPGEAVYLGIWEMTLNETTAVGRPWRLDEGDMRAVMRAARDPIIGAPVLREAAPRDVPCAAHRLNNITQRQVC
jgi:hypothetical protein